MNFQEYLFVGVDTHKNNHSAVVINFFHQNIANLSVPNNAAKFADFIDQLENLGHNDETLVFGLEDTQGLGRPLAQWLVNKGYTVKEVNPAITKRQRKHNPNPDKSDEVDAKAIANALLSEWEDLPVVEEDEVFQAIRQLHNQRKQFVKQRTAIKNRLHKLLHQQYPDYEQFFSNPFGKTARAFWQKFPHPSLLKNYGETRLNKFLKKQARSIPNDKASKILSLVDKDKSINTAVEARISIIKMLLDNLAMVESNLEKIDPKLEEAVNKSDYQLTTMPGIGFRLAALFISNIRNIDRFSSADKLARYAGLAPVEYSSGSSRNHTSRKYGCRALNHAFHLLAVQQVGEYRNGKIKSQIAYSYYQKKLAEGKSKKAALTCLKRRLVDIIYAMMRDRSVYQPPELPEYDTFNRAS